MLDLKEPTVSHHLAKLHELGLVGMRSAGTTHLYQFNGDVLRQLNRELLTPEQVTSLGRILRAKPGSARCFGRSW